MRKKRTSKDEKGRAPADVSSAPMTAKKEAAQSGQLLRAKLHNISVLDADGPTRKGIQLTFSSTVDDGRSCHPVSPPVGFDPWSTTEVEMRKWIGENALKLTHPAMAQWSGAQIILRNRKLIEASGAALLEALTIVARHGLVMPQWMADEYIRHYLKIQRMEVATLDEAFGHKPMTRLAAKRERRKLIPLISKLLLDALNKNPERPIGKELFEEIGQMQGIGKSATFVEEAYYEGVRDQKMQDLTMMKKLKLFPFR